ncbi:MAG: hypothetical protein IKN37_05005 [Bacteroidales bacterium]|nr:hypothetical protein [Bacteroidales bacterium]
MVKIFGKIWLLAVCLFACCMLSAQNVTNIVAEQVEKKIHVSYDLDRRADITLFLSTDGGKTFTELHRVSGDVGKNIAAGHRTIIWDVLSEQDRLVGEDFVFKVKAEGDAMVLRQKKEKQSVKYCRFITLNTAYSPLPQWSYGFKVGGLKTWGWYASLMSNFNFEGIGEPFQTGNTYILSGKSKTIRFSAQAGLVYRPCKSISIILGAGYGYRTITYRSKLADNDEIWYSWHSYPERTFKGVDVSCGLLFNIENIVFSVETVTTGFQTIEARIGVGCLSENR